MFEPTLISTDLPPPAGNATIETAPTAAASAAPIPAGEVLELANASAKESTEGTKKESTEGIRAAEAVECVVREPDQKRSEGRAEDEKSRVDGTDNLTQKASNPSLTQSGQDPAVGSPQNSQGQSQQDVPEGKLCDKNAAGVVGHDIQKCSNLVPAVMLVSSLPATLFDVWCQLVPKLHCGHNFKVCPFILLSALPPRIVARAVVNFQAAFSARSRKVPSRRVSYRKTRISELLVGRKGKLSSCGTLVAREERDVGS